MKESEKIPDSQKSWKVTSAFIFLILVVSLGIFVTISFLPAAQANNIVKKGVGIYHDITCEESIDQIPWGKISAGSSVSQTVYIKNEEYYSGSLTLTTLNWSPSKSSDYITLGWNYTGQRIAQNEVIPIELTLIVPEESSEINDFSFNIIITIVQ